MRMRLLALMPNLPDTSPGQRFRLEQWAPYLRAEGIDITLAPFETEPLHAVLYEQGRGAQKLRSLLSALRRRQAVVRSAREYDAVYLFREAALLGPPFLEWQLRRM